MAVPSTASYQSLNRGTDFHVFAAAITPSNQTALTVPTEAIHVGGAGAVNAFMATTVPPTALQFTADDVANTLIFATAHGLAANTKVALYTAGTLPDPLSAATIYYVIVVDTLTIQLETSVGGGAVNLTDTGEGDHFLVVIDAAILFAAVPAGKRLPLRVHQILAAGTTATSILGLW